MLSYVTDNFQGKNHYIYRRWGASCGSARKDSRHRMKPRSRYKPVLINALIALGISLVANFSILIFRLVPRSDKTGREGEAWIKLMHSWTYQSLEFLYYFLLAFILLVVVTAKAGGVRRHVFAKRALLCIGITCVLYFFAPHVSREGYITVLFNAHHLINPMLILKVSFTLAVVLLYGKIYELVYQKQNIVLENQVLRNENLQTTYDTLVNQINPHFFFNSLNSLSMLVREGRNDNALAYIDRLSDTFRYILDEGRSGGTTLEEELRFTEAYKYLLEVRYEGKLSFEIDIEPRYLRWTLPSLSLQPLIENVVKHNKITSASPMRVSVVTRDGSLVVSNPVSPKMDAEPGSGIGLSNLSQRYVMLTGRDIEVSEDGETFSVGLPLGEPHK